MWRTALTIGLLLSSLLLGACSTGYYTRKRACITNVQVYYREPDVPYPFRFGERLSTDIEDHDQAIKKFRREVCKKGGGDLFFAGSAVIGGGGIMVSTVDVENFAFMIVRLPESEGRPSPGTASTTSEDLLQQIHLTALRNHAQVEICVLRAALRGEVQKGKHRIAMSWVVNAVGKAESVVIDGPPEVANSGAAACISEAAADWLFPHGAEAVQIRGFEFEAIRTD